MKNSRADSTAQAATTGSKSPSKNLSTSPSVYLRPIQYRRLKYCKSPTAIAMASSDSDSDEEYRRRWRDHSDYPDDGEI